jgi:integrase/recombinase XerD
MVELPNVEEEPVEPYKEADLRKLFAKMTPEEEVRYRFFLDTACREQEVACAQWSDIDWQKAEYHVRSKTWKAPNRLTKSFTTKNHKTRRVPLTRELVDMLRTRQMASSSVWIFPNEEGQPEGHFLRKFKKAAYRAGLNCGHCEPSCRGNPEGCEKHYLHRLRKTRATFWHPNGVSLRTIQYWLSHESLETTMKYLGIEDSAKLQKEINLPMY